ncbi:MAG: AbrB family transcriptional regulator, partial [Eubacteriales bacterium]
MPDYILGLVVSAIVALLVKKTNIAGGMLIGAIIGMAFCCIVLETSALPVEFKLTAQIMAGIFIGAGVKREELLHLPRLAGPISLLMVIYTLFAISMGAIMPMVSDMDAITGMMCAVPGGMSDMPIIAADFGADVPTVAIFQFVRMIGGVAVFPSVITFVLRNSPESVAVEVEQHPTNPPTPPKPQRLWLILLVGGIAGLYGQTPSIPAG